MERLLMREAKILFGKLLHFVFFALFLAAICVLLFITLQGIPALGAYLQNTFGGVKTGYYLVSLVFLLTPTTLAYIMLSKN